MNKQIIRQARHIAKGRTVLLGPMSGKDFSELMTYIKFYRLAGGKA